MTRHSASQRTCLIWYDFSVGLFFRSSFNCAYYPADRKVDENNSYGCEFYSFTVLQFCAPPSLALMLVPVVRLRNTMHKDVLSCRGYTQGSARPLVRRTGGGCMRKNNRNSEISKLGVDAREEGGECRPIGCKINDPSAKCLVNDWGDKRCWGNNQFQA